jgi:hypothetical protein
VMWHSENWHKGDSVPPLDPLHLTSPNPTK